MKEILCRAILAILPGRGAIQIRSAFPGVNLGIAVLDRGPAISADAINRLFRILYESVPGRFVTLAPSV